MALPTSSVNPVDLLHLMADLTPASIALFGADLRLRYLNAEAKRLTILPESAHTAVGLALRELPHSASFLDRVEELLRKVIDTKTPLTDEIFFPSPVGNRWMHATLTPILNADGAVDSIVCIGADITDRKEAEQAAKEQEERYRRAIREGRVFPWEHDYETSLTRVEPDYLAMISLTPETIPYGSEGWFRWMHPEDQGAARAALAACFAGTADRFEYEYRAKCFQGQLRWFWARGLVTRRENGKLWKAQGVTIDITERRQAQEALKASEQLFAAFMANVPALAWIKDESGRFEYTNPPLQRFFQRTAKEILGKTDLEFFPPDLAAVLRQHDQCVLSENQPLSVTEFTRDPDGTQRPWLVIKFPLDLPQGRRVGGFAIDISEQRRLQEEQRKVEQQLIQSQKLESLGVLAGGIAHDFNNLLTAMLGYASLAALDATLSQQTQGYLEQIENAARQAGNLCRQMLAYAGRGQFVIQPVELNHLVHEMAQLLQTAISKQVNLRLQLSPEETMIMADQTQMRQVILNLITNASEALGKNSGTIALTTTSIEVTEQVAAEYRGWSLAGGRHVLLEVADTGMGMSEEIQAKIFEPFFTTKFTGRGLGLAAVQGIVRSHKGAIRIDSKMGQGTRFKILLPTTTQASPPAQPQPVTPTHESGENRWVLVVDDDEAIRELARKTLEHAGFQVTTANDGKEAVEIFQRDPSRYELVLLDLTMPRMGGNQACRHLRAIRPNVLILLMSGYSTHDALAGLDEGLAGFLRKPFRANDLLEAISNLLTR